MKDVQPCQHTLSDDAMYKEVVVIGNGPSGLVTSFMLAGNVPYLKQIPDDLPIDEMLRARLSSIPEGQSLYETDLFELAEGLEGRSQNPIPILMDNLLRPCTDLDYDAESLIEWRFDAEKQIEHIVLGRGPPGGAWHTFPREVRTLSSARWLALPPHSALSPSGEPLPSQALTPAAEPRDRLPASAVANYCRKYVQACKLQRYLRSGVVVGSVTRAARAEPCGHRHCPRNAAYCVAGYDKTLGRSFRVLCRRVVIAAGGSERPNTLPVLKNTAIHSLAEAERAIKLLSNQRSRYGQATCVVVGSGVSAADGVRVSRAACVLTRHLHAAPAHTLAHLPRRTHPHYAHVYEMMMDGTPGKYPYYESYPSHVITDVTTPQDNDPLAPKTLRLLNLATEETTHVTANIIVVLIGSKPDLFFLQTNFNLNCLDLQDNCKCEAKRRKVEEDGTNKCFFRNHWSYLKSVIDSCKSRYGNADMNKINLDSSFDSKICQCDNQNLPKMRDSESKCTCHQQLSNPYSNGIGFGVDPSKPVDCRLNPVAVDKRTHELLNAPSGLYALGPLTADNFVRFIPGGALAIVSHIHKEMKSTIE